MPVMRSKRRVRDENYETRLQAAKVGLARGLYRSISEAASKNNVARQTLSDRVNGTHKSRSEASKPRQLLTPAQEDAVLDWCDERSRAANPFALRSAAPAFTGNRPGKGWHLRYENRNASLKLLKPCRLDSQHLQDQVSSDGPRRPFSTVPHNPASYSASGSTVSLNNPDTTMDFEMPPTQDIAEQEGSDDAASDLNSRGSGCQSVVTDVSDPFSAVSQDYTDRRTRSSSSSSTVSINTVCKRMTDPHDPEKDRRSVAEMAMEYRMLQFQCQLLKQQQETLQKRLALVNPDRQITQTIEDIDAKLNDPIILASLKPSLVTQLEVLNVEKATRLERGPRGSCGRSCSSDPNKR